MVQLYIKRILAGQMMIDDVPVKWRDAVREALEN